VLIKVKPIAAISSENQPPSSILSALAPRKAKSTGRNTTPSATAPRPHPQRRRATTHSSAVVISIVAVTAIPYAAARFADEPKPTTSAHDATISAQFTAPT
jgi:hypothetical protein